MRFAVILAALVMMVGCTDKDSGQSETHTATETVDTFEIHHHAQEDRANYDEGDNVRVQFQWDCEGTATPVLMVHAFAINHDTGETIELDVGVSAVAPQARWAMIIEEASAGAWTATAHAMAKEHQDSAMSVVSFEVLPAGNG